MKNKDKKGFTKQIVSAGVYIALAAAVVGVSTNAVVSILSDNIQNVEIPENTNETKYEIRDIELPEVPSFPEFKRENLEAPVSGTQDGISARTEEKADIADDKQKADESEKVPESHSHEEQSATEKQDFGYPGFVEPCEGFVTQEFSPDVLVYSPTMYDYRVHLGTDIACELATPIKAISGGTVTDVAYDSLLGKSVTIESADGLVICYRNLSEALPQGIEKGSIIKTGEVIGGVGQTALSESAEAPHVHIEATRNGEYFDVTELY